MDNAESWESKRQEVWKRIVEAEGTIEDFKKQFTGIEETLKIKVLEDEEKVAEAAKTAKANLDKITELLKQVEPLSMKFAEAQKTLSAVTSSATTVKAQAAEIDKSAKAIAEIKVTCEAATKTVATCQEKATKATEDANAKWTTVNQQVQNIATLEAGASKDAASVKASREIIEKSQTEIAQLKVELEKIKTDWTQTFSATEKKHSDQLTTLHTAKEAELKKLIADSKTGLQTEITQLKAELEKIKTDWTQTFSTTEKKHSDQLTTLHTAKEAELKKLIADKTTLLSELNMKYIEEFEKLTKEIENLLPGATSAGLASAFAERRESVERNKKGWGGLLIASAFALIGFGVYLLFYKESQAGLASSFAGRTLIVGGLILLEEFARRNFNIISRLSEAYAYKEALAKSYLGYKKQMENIPMPSSEEKTVGQSVLMKTFLDKLEDEPGKHVFDKEKHAIGIVATIDKLSPNNPDNAIGKTVEELSKGNLLAKTSWPIVVIIAILAITGCIVVYLLKA